MAVAINPGSEGTRRQNLRVKSIDIYVADFSAIMIEHELPCPLQAYIAIPGDGNNRNVELRCWRQCLLNVQVVRVESQKSGVSKIFPTAFPAPQPSILQTYICPIFCGHNLASPGGRKLLLLCCICKSGGVKSLYLSSSVCLSPTGPCRKKEE